MKGSAYGVNKLLKITLLKTIILNTCCSDSYDENNEKSGNSLPRLISFSSPHFSQS